MSKNTTNLDEVKEIILLKNYLEDLDLKYAYEFSNGAVDTLDLEYTDYFYSNNFDQLKFSKEDLEKYYSDLEIADKMAREILKKYPDIEDLLFDIYN